MTDPWMPPPPGGTQSGGTQPDITQPGGEVNAPAAQQPVRRRLSLQSVPDGRSVVPSVWWVPLVAVVALTTTGIYITGTSRTLALTVSVLAVSLLGYLSVCARIRPARLPAKGPISGLKLLAAAVIALGFSGIWAIIVNQLIRPTPVSFSQSRSVISGLLRSAANALGTSILEECGIAMVILATAGLVVRIAPTANYASVALISILTGTVARTVLHIPLWGMGALGRIGLALALAWLYWRTRRIWPLIVAHLLWDTLALQVLISPSASVKLVCGVLIVGWALAGAVIGVVAGIRSLRSGQLG